MHVGPFLEESDEWTRRQVDVNLHGVILGMKLALPAMVARGSGHVINVASAAAKIGVPREAVYAASKHAVLGVSQSVRLELRGSGVELSVVMPGLVRTELSTGTLKGGLILSPEDVAQAIVATIERPRFDVYVPRAYAAISTVGQLLPRRAREAVLRLAGAERATAGTTAAAARGLRGSRPAEHVVRVVGALDRHEPVVVGAVRGPDAVLALVGTLEVDVVAAGAERPDALPGGAHPVPVGVRPAARRAPRRRSGRTRSARRGCRPPRRPARAR